LAKWAGTEWSTFGDPRGVDVADERTLKIEEFDALLEMYGLGAGLGGSLMTGVGGAEASCSCSSGTPPAMTSRPKSSLMGRGGGRSTSASNSYKEGMVRP
jgi:hypothetical protein